MQSAARIMGYIKSSPTTSMQNAYMYVTDSNVIWRHCVNSIEWMLSVQNESAKAERAVK